MNDRSPDRGIPLSRDESADDSEEGTINKLIRGIGDLAAGQTVTRSYRSVDGWAQANAEEPYEELIAPEVLFPADSGDGKA